MKHFMLLTFALMFIFEAHSDQVYKCEDSGGRLLFQGTPCDEKPKGIQARSDAREQEKLTGERFDRAMWILLEEPYRSEGKVFIDHVVANDLLLKKDSDGDTVLSVAALNGQAEVIDYLVRNGTRVDSTNNRGYTILSFAVKLNDPVKVALIHYGADINHSGERGHTPLINAVLFDDLQTVNFLLSHGAIIDRVDHEGGSALFYAAAQGNLAIVKRLVESGANVNIGTKLKPLTGALAKSHYLVSAYLTLQGATR